MKIPFHIFLTGLLLGLTSCSGESVSQDRLNSSNTINPISAPVAQAPVVKLTTPVDGSLIQQGIVDVKGSVTPYSRELRLSVNGVSTTLSPTGNFAGQIPLLAGTNEIEAKVYDMSLRWPVSSDSVEVSVIAKKGGRVYKQP